MRVSLDQADFRLLIRGSTVEKWPRGERVEVTLQDIGFDAMYAELLSAMVAMMEGTQHEGASNKGT